MKLKPVIAGAVIRDPVTRQPLPAAGGDVPDGSIHWTRRWLDGEVWRLEGDAWVRRLPDGHVERASAGDVQVGETVRVAGAQPPVAPLTTR